MNRLRRLGPDERDLERGGEHDMLMAVVEERRDPRADPVAGDRFVLNGRNVEIVYVNHDHCVRPEVSYRLMNWKRWDGGRAQYELSLKSFHRKFSNAVFVNKKSERKP